MNDEDIKFLANIMRNIYKDGLKKGVALTNDQIFKIMVDASNMFNPYDAKENHCAQ